MADDTEREPSRMVRLGATRFVIDPVDPDEPGAGYLLHRAEDTVTLASFTRDEAQEFERDWRNWIRETGS